MKKILHSKIFLSIMVLIFALVSTPVFAQEKLVPCDGPNCDFNSFVDLINNIINFALMYLAIPIAAIMFAYAGFLMVTAGESASEARTKAKGIFMNALMGLAIAAACWLIVNTILSVLGYDGSWLGFKQI